MNKQFSLRFFLILASSVLFFTTAFLLETHYENVFNDKSAATYKTQQLLQTQEKEINLFLDTLMQQLNDRNLSGLPLDLYLNRTGFELSGFTHFLFEGSNLIYWSNNNVLYSGSVSENVLNQSLIFYKNAWYEIFIRKSSDRTLVGLLLIKRQFSFENQYLKNTFNPVLRIAAYASISTEETDNQQYPIYNADGLYLFSVDYDSSPAIYKPQTVSQILIFLGLLLLFIFLYAFVKFLSTQKPLLAFIAILGLIAVRVVCILYQFPKTLYTSPLFSPIHYASSPILNSLGDLLISSLVFSYIVIFFYQYLNRYQPKAEKTIYKFLLSARVVGAILFTFLYSVFINYLLSGLIMNSSISFDVSNIFNLTEYSIIGFFIIAILLFTFYMVSDGSVRFINKTGFNTGQKIILFLITQGVFLVILLWLRNTAFFIDYGVSSFLLTNSLMIFISYVRRGSVVLFSFNRSILFIFVFSLYAAQIIILFNDIKEKDNRTLLLTKLENTQDYIAEFLFSDLEQRIQKDKFIASYLNSETQRLITDAYIEDVLHKRLSHLYFNGYWDRYELNVNCFDNKGRSITEKSELSSLGIELYKDLLSKRGSTTANPNLSYISNNLGRNSYIAWLNIFSDSNEYLGSLIIELNSKSYRETEGFPELLISDKVETGKEFAGYSYAIYRNNKLIRQFGNFPYLISSGNYWQIAEITSKPLFVNIDGYSHLFSNSGKNELIAISKKRGTFINYITLFSYLFAFHFTLFIIFYLVIRLFFFTLMIPVSFKGRIQISFLSIVIASILIFGAGSVVYIYNSYQLNQSQRIREQLNSIIKDLELDFNREGGPLTEITQATNFNMEQLASTLSLDFNLYSFDGLLLFTTQDKVFEQGLAGETMNRLAYQNLKVLQKSQFNHFENIGLLRFISAYKPVRNINNETIGFINLPYFAKQNVLENEISGFLVALINIYVLLFSVAILSTFIISSRITEPLRLIQERLSKIRFGESNEAIEYKSKDEIGLLVHEYNRMIDELAQSANLLARSERETAWREMAKQVAHEIKNPLTPMKLNLQHLQKAWEDKSENLDLIMHKLSNTLIEQIDTLSSIANEFSNFAKMPKPNNAKIDLSNILKTCCNLYSETEEINLTYEPYKAIDMWIFADKDQLSRVFSNLIKNAIQSIPPTEQGEIRVIARRDMDNFIVEIKDNGIGIPDDQVANIFVPNFTTKTGGTGLGLAMVKNIVEYSNGTIWFDSNKNSGTSFYVSIPVYDKPNVEN